MTIEKKKIKMRLKDVEKIRGPMTFAKLLHSFRVTQNFTQEELANKLGLSKGNICDYEKGRKIPTPAYAEKIAKKLGEIPAYWVEIAIQDMLRENKLLYLVNIKPIDDAA